MGRRNKPTASKARGLRPFYIVVALVAVIGAAAIAYAVAGGGSAALELVELEGVDDPRSLVAKAEGVSIGDPSAPSKMLVFADFQCPVCAQFTAQVEPLLKAEYVQTGKLELVYHDYPMPEIHRHAFIAARAARCAGEQGKFWEYHDVLLGEQNRWAGSSRAPLGDFEEYAERVGLDRGAFGSCLRSDRFADVVSANRLLGERLGVTGTPALILNGRRLERWNYAALKAALDREAGG